MRHNCGGFGNIRDESEAPHLSRSMAVIDANSSCARGHSPGLFSRFAALKSVNLEMNASISR